MITVQPTNEVVSLLGIVTFAVGATSNTTLYYQWYKDGSPILFANSSTYSILNVLGSSVGTYAVKVTNAGGSIMSSPATLSLTPVPGISTPPASQTVTQGQTASFSVVASGSMPLVYQWKLNGVAIVGATNSSLILTNVQGSQAGYYTVLVTNASGSAIGGPASLTVHVPASIATQPQSQNVLYGQSTELLVVPNGSSPLSYQWRLNGVALLGATNSALALTHIKSGQAGNYTVDLSNPWGAVTSDVATLTVTNPPSLLSLPPTSGTSGQGFTFQVSLPGGSTYIILASTNLREWTPIYTNVSVADTISFTDPTAGNYQRRFYRTLVP